MRAEVAKFVDACRTRAVLAAYLVMIAIRRIEAVCCSVSFFCLRLSPVSRKRTQSVRPRRDPARTQVCDAMVNRHGAAPRRRRGSEFEKVGEVDGGRPRGLRRGGRGVITKILVG